MCLWSPIVASLSLFSLSVSASLSLCLSVSFSLSDLSVGLHLAQSFLTPRGCRCYSAVIDACESIDPCVHDDGHVCMLIVLGFDLLYNKVPCQMQCLSRRRSARARFRPNSPLVLHLLCRWAGDDACGMDAHDTCAARRSRGRGSAPVAEKKNLNPF